MIDENFIINDEFKDLLVEDDVDDFVEMPKRNTKKRNKFNKKGVYVAS